LAWATTSAGKEEESDAGQKLAKVVEGWEFFKLTWDSLNDPPAKLKAKFCADSLLVFLKLFKERCYEAWNAVEEACPSLGKRKQNWW
jgi:hypothetical protein